MMIVNIAIIIAALGCLGIPPLLPKWIGGAKRT
jgi:hypothetical protein